MKIDIEFVPKEWVFKLVSKRPYHSTATLQSWLQLSSLLRLYTTDSDNYCIIL